MAEFNGLMKQCVIDANEDFPDLNWEDTVYEAFKSYVIITGNPLEFDSEEEGYELLEEARRFLLDCVLFNMVRDGLVEVVGMEDDELVYQLAKNTTAT